VRLRLDLSYDGTDFHGWAIQPGQRTVQGLVQDALAQILRLEGASVTCAGRTDAGVHARAQVVHVDVDRPVLEAIVGRSAAEPIDALVRRLNGLLPPDVRVRRASEAAAGFDARFSAIWRRYAYRIADAPHLADPLRRREVLTRPRELDLLAMNESAAVLLGEHDFAAFCKRRSGATTIRTLLELSWARDTKGLAVATVRADAFCHNMVRALVGCLVEVGEHRQSPSWSAAVLTARVRDPAVRVLRARGLTLEEVAYPPDEELADQARAARVVRTLPGEECCDG
jgi:tRNA pseudouridine38-40 synthase